MNFAGLASWIEPGSCDGVLLDLVVNSTQLDSADRGFSFQQDGPLDMRLNPLEGVSASAICNEASADELMKIFREYADEPHARRIALAIARARRDAPFTRTAQLANLVEQVNPRRGARTHPATRVFQSLRIAVNDELGSLRAGLPAALQVLKPGGRLAVISFHSAEDRIAKEFGRVASRDYVQPCDTDIPELRQPRTPLVRLVTRKPIRPTADEIASNPRARSAQLRVFEKAQPQSNQTP